LLTTQVEKFSKSDPRKLEVEYRLNDGDIQAAFVASTGQSDNMEIAETIDEKLGGDAYFESKNTVKAPSGLAEGQALGTQIINSGVNYIVQWGYEINGSVDEWFDYCYVDDLISTISDPDHIGKVTPDNVSVALKSGKIDVLIWNYQYPIEST
jgi:hypothetical protein